MKHTYITILCLLSAATFSFAQKKPLTIPVQNFPEHYMESIQTGNGILPDMPAQPNNIERTSNNSVRGGSPALWQEDFGGGFPNGWGIDDVTGLNPWKWTTNGSHGYFNGNNNGGGYADPMNSTTAGNGFLICDNDSANHFNYGQPSGTTYQYLESYFVTNQIDLGASYSSLLLEFEQSFRFNNSVDLVVQVSADSVNWTSYKVQEGVDNNTASDDPDLVSVNISAAVGASQFVYLKIGWNARVYYWMIDDMKIVEGLDNDLELTKAYHGDVVNDFVYSKIPLEQASEMVVGAAVTNLGGLTQTNVTVDYEILRGGTSVASGSFTFLNDIVAADTDTAWHATNYTPDQTGDYEVFMTVSADNTDENLDNQSNSSNMEVTEFVFAHDYDESFELQVWGRDDDNGSANAYGHGSVYIPYNSGSSIYAIQAAFGSNTTTGTSIIAEVHELGSSIQDIVDSYITVFDLVPGNVNGGSGFFFTTIVLDEEVPLNAGTGYTIALQSDGGDDQLWLLSNSGNEDNSTTLYGPYGTGGATNWYNGWNHTPGLRMNLNPNIAGVDEDIEKLGFGMYPNPAANSVSFLFASESDINSITITDMNGKLVSRLAVNSSNGSKLDVDVSNLSSGVYLVSTVGTQTISSNKLIIQH
ncbi:MAG: T9SS type A sorting domain-containing protein [Flavobacteriales bacterium]|nr:T9SS type A sorting domain-containing protein [Flavobacteriales bacterium]